ncbi:colanic acid/amylovoran biosynthesis protein [Psychrobacillus insolitus]|uniref:Colanic acid/amylovoran biosynthesis protein n=1 Tax=Psychrobacillus insolitus TaxID=1461 RepID=A0A2W7MHD3_9BACI|nr:polysaccharide pyruvyl transferase family protein [Psychrobacillus insolitus]PZX05948.1 colanic acid/amylovoran biosynthesis protein [Psychrobacillus insolitus]
MEKLKINLYGYVQNNLGDDLFFEYVVNRYPSYTFKLFAPPIYLDTFSNTENIKLIYPSLSKRVLNKFYKSIFKKNLNLFTSNVDVSLLVGGSLFIENMDWEIGHKEFTNKFLASNQNYLLGANFGPYSSQEFYNSYQRVFTNFEDICFREEYSKQLFKHLKNVRVAPDMLFGYKNNDFIIKEEKKVFISVIKPSIRKDLIEIDTKYFKGITKLVEKYTLQGYEISLVSFCQAEGDEQAIDEIYSLLRDKKSVRKIYYKGINREEIISELSSSEIIVATRFHAMILGWVFNKKVLPLIYSDKTLNVIKDVGFSGKYIDIRKDDDYSINQKEIGFLEDVTSIAIESERHFEVLDTVLK